MAKSTLLDSRGNPVISSAQFKRKPPAQLGEAKVTWGDDLVQRNFGTILPGLGAVQFNLDRLTVDDFRAMRSHYQINASLSVLSFMQHQSDWHIECEDQRIADECEYQLREQWTPLNRALSTANWAGYSPNVLQWENDPIRGRTVLDKIKDLPPESCLPNWKEVDAWVPAGSNFKNAKVKIYDGIKQAGTPWPIPAENTIWYSLLMENGNLYGQKLLKAAFTSWYFSILVHLYANRYYERFGEPVVRGRAPFDETLEVPDGEGGFTEVDGITYMQTALNNLRSRGVITLPGFKSQAGDSGHYDYDYSVDYLESAQMRGADFEKYLTRLDEEISIGLFTPILLLRTADVGSYNLGVGHMQMYLWMLNAMNNDRAQYINKYILSRITDYNFSVKAPRPRIKFRKLGNQNMELVQAVLTAMIGKGKIEPADVIELGEITGMTLKEINETVEDPQDSGEEDLPEGSEGDQTVGDAATGDAGEGTRPRATAEDITARVAPQVSNAFENGNFDQKIKLDYGYQRQVREQIGVRKAEQFYKGLDSWVKSAASAGAEAYEGPEEFMQMFTKVAEASLK